MLGLYSLSSIKGNIFLNGIMYSICDSIGVLVGGYVVNRFGTFATGKFVNIIALCSVIFRLIFPEN